MFISYYDIMHHHGHIHGHIHTHGHQSVNGILTAFLLNFTFAIIEIVGGVFTNSIAIISDAIHDLGDSLAIGLAYIFEQISQKKPNEQYTYGYARYSILGALITVVILIIGSVFILKNAISKFSNPSEINSIGMLILAIIGLGINGFAAIKTSKGHGLNEKAITLHLLEDVLGWATVLMGALLIYFFHWNFVDPLLSIGICIFILINAIKLLKGILDVFLEKVPKGLSPDHISTTLKYIDGVLDVHHIHLWTIDGNSNYITIHVLIDKKLTIPDIIILKRNIQYTLKKENISHSIVEFEWEDEICKRGIFCE